MSFKRIHLWLHNNYEGVRFWVGMSTAAFLLFAFFATTQAEIKDNREVTQRRTEQIEKIVNELKADNEHQTQLIACLLAIHGQTSTISAEDAERCRAEAEQEINGTSSDAGDASNRESINPGGGGTSGGSGSSGGSTEPEPDPIREIIEAISGGADRIIDTLNPQ